MIEVPIVDDEELPSNIQQLLGSINPAKVAEALTMTE